MTTCVRGFAKCLWHFANTQNVIRNFEHRQFHTTPPFFSRKARKQSKVRKAPPIPFIYGVFRKRKGEKESGRGVQLNAPTPRKNSLKTFTFTALAVFRCKILGGRKSAIRIDK